MFLSNTPHTRRSRKLKSFEGYQYRLLSERKGIMGIENML